VVDVFSFLTSPTTIAVVLVAGGFSAWACHRAKRSWQHAVAVFAMVVAVWSLCGLLAYLAAWSLFNFGPELGAP
jgi:hypothetical protein